MQPPTNFNAMPEFYSGNNYPMPGQEENGDRVRRRSSSVPPSEKAATDQSQGPFTANLQTDIAKMAWEAGSNQVKRAFFLYTNIDIFRPYFDVEPKQVRNRLIQSLIPRKPASMKAMGADLYGPLVLIFTLVAILLYSMKTSGYEVKDGTLIGTAFFTCFAYWFFASLGVYAIGYVFVCRVGMLQVFSIMGYALFSHCLVLGISAVAHHIADSHATFYALFAICGGLSSLRMAVYFASKTPAKTHKLMLAAVVIALHLGFVLYLHFGYHKVVEEINEMLGNENVHQLPMAPAVPVVTEAQAVPPIINPAVPKEVVQQAAEVVTKAVKQLGERLSPLGSNGRNAVHVAPPSPVLAHGV